MQAPWDDGYHYKGVVQRVGGDGAVDVRFDDGDVGRGVKVASLRDYDTPYSDEDSDNSEDGDDADAGDEGDGLAAVKRNMAASLLKQKLKAKLDKLKLVRISEDARKRLGMVVLSCFDGIGTLLHVLKELQIKVLLYVAVELDDEAFTTTAGQHGKYCEIRRVKDVGNTGEVVAALGGLPVDLVVGGPPCHDLSGSNPNRAARAGVQTRALRRVVHPTLPIAAQEAHRDADVEPRVHVHQDRRRARAPPGQGQLHPRRGERARAASPTRALAPPTRVSSRSSR